MSSDRHLDGESADLCPDPEIAEITKISRFRGKSRFWRFWRFLALDTILARFAVRSTFWPDPRKWPLWRVWPQRLVGGPSGDVRSETWIRGLIQVLTKVARWTSDLPESASQVLYIDHFQLPPWWKMTGEDGDPFGGRR